MTFLVALSVQGGTGIHGPPWTGTDRSESVRDVQDFVGPGPVRYLQIFLVPGPVRSQGSKFFLVLVWFGPVQVLKLLFVLVRSEIPGLGPGLIGFDRWISEGKCK